MIDEAVRKANGRILPLLGLAYLFAYMDRVNISFASVQMNADLGFSATVYGIGAGMFFASYALFEVPSNMLMLKFGARRWIARIMVTWGLLAAAMMFVREPWQFYSLRFLIGFAEAGFFPAVVHYLAHWFPDAHRGRAISRFYVFGPLTSVVMGLVSAWMLGLDGRAGLRGWEWLFLLQGAPAVVLGLVVLKWLPDSPERAEWLPPAEREALCALLTEEAARRGDLSDHNVLRALRNPTVLWLGAIGMTSIAAFYGLTLSAPAVLMAGTGLTIDDAGTIVSIGGAIGAASMLFAGWYSDRTGERIPLLFVAMAGFAASFLVIAASSGATGTVGGYLLFSSCWTMVTVLQVMLWADLLPTRTLAIGAAAINTMSQVGAFVWPIVWGVTVDATGGYERGLALTSGVAIMGMAILFFLSRKVRRDRELANAQVFPGIATAGFPQAPGSID